MRYLDQTEQYYEAIHSFKDAVEANPEYWEAYQGLARAYFAVGNIPKTIEAAEESLKLNPMNPDLRRVVDRLKLKPPEPQTMPRPESLPEKEQLALMGGLVFNRTNPDSGLSLGVRGLYRVEPNLWLGGTLGYQSILSSYEVDIPVPPGSGQVSEKTKSIMTNLELLGSVKYSLSQDPQTGSYLLGGFGLSLIRSDSRAEILSTYPPIPSMTQDFAGDFLAYPLFQAGVGFEIEAGNGMLFFVECKADVILSGEFFTFFPFNAGLLMDL